MSIRRCIHSVTTGIWHPSSSLHASPLFGRLSALHVNGWSMCMLRLAGQSRPLPVAERSHHFPHLPCCPAPDRVEIVEMENTPRKPGRKEGAKHARFHSSAPQTGAGFRQIPSCCPLSPFCPPTKPMSCNIGTDRTGRTFRATRSPSYAVPAARRQKRSARPTFSCRLRARRSSQPAQGRTAVAHPDIRRRCTPSVLGRDTSRRASSRRSRA